MWKPSQKDYKIADKQNMKYKFNGPDFLFFSDL